MRLFNSTEKQKGSAGKTGKLLNQSIFPSYPKQNNMVFEDENVSVSVFWKNEVSEESRHCLFKNNNTTKNNSIVETPFSLKVSRDNIWSILCIRKALHKPRVTKRHEVKMEGIMVSGVLGLRGSFAVGKKSLCSPPVPLHWPHRKGNTYKYELITFDF